MFVTWVYIVTFGMMTILIHLEGLWLLRKLPPVFDDHPRAGVLSVVFMCLILHVIEITLYAAGFMSADHFFHVGQFNDEKNLDAMAYFYYSAITYTAVGYGDILPTSDIRLLAVAESLNGLLLIGWSGAFSFIAMQKLWSERATRRRDERKASRKKKRGAADER